MELFRAVASGGQDLDITLLGKQPRFLVGSVVEVSRRKQAGVNKEGGAATVALVRGDPVSGYVYDINYILTSSCEGSLPESFLSDPNDLTEKKRRCSLEAGGSSIEGASHVCHVSFELYFRFSWIHGSVRQGSSWLMYLLCRYQPSSSGVGKCPSSSRCRRSDAEG